MRRSTLVLSTRRRITAQHEQRIKETKEWQATVAGLQSLGLTVVADEQAGGLTGHALIPELSLAACQRDKPRSRAIQVRLAEMASNNIICIPSVKESS